MSLSGRPVYDLNPLRPNPNPKKPVSGSCCVYGLGRTLTLLLNVAFLIRLLFGIVNHRFSGFDLKVVNVGYSVGSYG